MSKRIFATLIFAFSFFGLAAWLSPVLALNCSADTDCPNGQYCYQPPFVCPDGQICAQVMPAKYCAVDENAIISIGETLPAALTYTPITTTSQYPTIYSLRNFMPKAQTQSGEIGYAMGFSFEGLQGEMLESLVTELEVASVGSYIRTHLYGPDDRLITDADTRIDFTVSQAGTFHLIATTFDNKQGDIAVQVFDREAQKLKGSFVGQSLDAVIPPQLLPTYGSNIINMGRIPFSLRLEFPDTVYIKDNGTVEYFAKEAAQTMKIRPTVYRDTSSAIINKVNSRTGINPLPVIITQVSDKSLSIRPAGTDLFSAGYHYAFISDIIYENDPGVHGTNFYTYFAAISTSGLTADLNNDNKVNLADFTILSNEFMSNSSQLQADIDGDGRVNLNDYTILATQFGNN